MSSSKHSHSGFTLLELLLVIFLLGVLAMTTFAVVQDGDDQQRYDATKTYYQLIKKAVIGDPSLVLNGETDVSGFVADMGRLPNCLRELLEITGCDASNEDDDLPVWTQDIESQVWSGWRGPYLQGIPESGGLTFRDGWKNTGGGPGDANPDAFNYGWLFGIGAADGTACHAANVAQVVPGSLYLQSCGSNAAVDNVSTGNYSDDYPFLSSTSYQPMVVDADHQAVLGSAWDNLMVEIINDAGLPLDIEADSLRLSFNYPINGTLPVCVHPSSEDCNPDFAPFLSGTFPEFILSTNATGKVFTLKQTQTITFPVGSTYAASVVSVFQDGRATLSDGSKIELRGCTVSAPCSVTTSGAASSFDDEAATLTANANDVVVTFPHHFVASIQFAVTGLLKPYIEVPRGSVISGAQAVTLPDGTTLTFNYNVAFTPGVALLPESERRVIVNVDDTDPVTVTVSSNVNMVGNKVFVNGAADVFMVPPGSSLDSTTQLTLTSGLVVPVGQRSLTVVCENANNPAGNYRKLYDGDCVGTDGGTPVPVQLKVKPRATLPPPMPIRWQIR